VLEDDIEKKTILKKQKKKKQASPGEPL